MRTVRSGRAIWLVGAPAGDLKPLRRGPAAVAARTAGLAGLLALTVFALAPAGTGAAARQAAPAAEAIGDTGKLAHRLSPPAEPAPAVTVPLAGTGASAADGMFDRRLTVASDARFHPSNDPQIKGSSLPGHFTRASGGTEWRETVFPQVVAVDGRTLDVGGFRIRLAGVALPRADEVCRTLDGRLEPCRARAATQLELIVRSRSVVCRYRMRTVSEAEGACRIGANDLADWIVRTGYAKRMAVASASVSAGVGEE